MVAYHTKQIKQSERERERERRREIEKKKREIIRSSSLNVKVPIFL